MQTKTDIINGLEHAQSDPSNSVAQVAAYQAEIDACRATPAMQTITIDSTIVPKLASWFQSGRGVRVWINQEIASGAAREVFTPGDAASPGWRYGNPVDAKPSDFEVEVFTPLQSFRGRFKAHFWGPWVAKATEAKAKSICASLGADVTWRWEYDEPGYVQVTIGRTTKQPFPNES